MEEVITEPILEDELDETKLKDYALLTPQEFSNMTDEEIKEWYKKTKNK